MNEKLDIVNPMNPNQVLETKDLIKQEVVVNIEPVHEEKPKKKKNLLIPILLLIVLIGLGTYYFMFFNRPTTKPEDETPISKETTVLNNIASCLEKNIKNHNNENDITITLKDDKHMVLTYTLEENIYTYNFEYSRGDLIVKITEDYPNVKEVISYILSAIGENYNVLFNQTMEYLDKKELDELNEYVTISDVNSIKVIRISTEQPIIKISE